jgi:UDP-N-acetylmuramoylalanine--D-glutamate ligase
MSIDVTSLLKDPRGQSAVVVGGGKTGAAAARLLVKLGANVTVVDDAPLEKVRAGLEKNHLDTTTVTLRAGGIDATAVAAASLVVLSPGVPRAHAAIAPALARGAAVINEVELAAAHLPQTVLAIGITGTNGKSTTTTMAGCIAKAFDESAFVGGNLGTPYCQAALDVLDGKPAPRVAVLELSSYQLETIEPGRLSLRAAVVTNLSPDHLDRYPSVEAYYAAKARIFALVDDKGGSSLNAADAESRKHLFGVRPGGRATCDFDVSGAMDGVTVEPGALVVRHGGPPERLSLQNPHIVGHHNAQNAAAAVAAAALCGLPPSSWQQGIDAYAGIAHRLERVGERDGVTWFNDSKGTNVDATVTAIKSFPRGIHLIAGGLGKGAPYEPMVEAGRGKIVAVYTIGQDAPAIAKAFAGHAEVIDCGTLDVACARAAARAARGDVILLSPACASFDQFRDYGHRGETFRALFAQNAQPHKTEAPR